MIILRFVDPTKNRFRQYVIEVQPTLFGGHGGFSRFLFTTMDKLKAALAGLQAQQRSFDPVAHVITSERKGAMSPATVANWLY